MIREIFYVRKILKAISSKTNELRTVYMIMYFKIVNFETKFAGISIGKGSLILILIIMYKLTEIL